MIVLLASRNFALITPIKYYLKDKGLLRFNNVTVKTKCYKEPGGMQVKRTKERIHNNAQKLVNDYPDLCRLNMGKKSGFTELTLRDRRLQNNNSNNNSTNKLNKILIKEIKRKRKIKKSKKINRDLNNLSGLEEVNTLTPPFKKCSK